MTSSTYSTTPTTSSPPTTPLIHADSSSAPSSTHISTNATNQPPRSLPHARPPGATPRYTTNPLAAKEEERRRKFRQDKIEVYEKKINADKRRSSVPSQTEVQYFPLKTQPFGGQDLKPDRTASTASCSKIEVYEVNADKRRSSVPPQTEAKVREP